MGLQLNKKQQEIKEKVELFASILDIDPYWAVAVAMTESSLGLQQQSPTGCKGVFQMSSIAMKDLLEEMAKVNDDSVDIACGTAFLKVLLKRWKSIDKATLHFCAPKDRDFYLNRVRKYMREFQRMDGEDV